MRLKQSQMAVRTKLSKPACRKEHLQICRATCRNSRNSRNREWPLKQEVKFWRVQTFLGADAQVKEKKRAS